MTTKPAGARTAQATRNPFLRHTDQLVDAGTLVRYHGSQFIDAFGLATA